MFSHKKEEPNPFDEAIDSLIRELAGHEGNSDEYTAIVANVKSLQEAKALTAPKPNSVSADVIANVVANIVGILIIVGHERVNVITSKALGFVLKSKP